MVKEPSLFAFAKAVAVTSQEHGPLEKELVGVLGIPAIGPVVLKPETLELAREPGHIGTPRPVVGPVAGHVQGGGRQTCAGIGRPQPKLRRLAGSA